MSPTSLQLNLPSPKEAPGALEEVLEQLSPSTKQTGSASSLLGPVASSRRGSQQLSADQPYVVLKTIGEGSYGKVKLATHRPTGEHVAIKFLSKAQISREPTTAMRIFREIATNRLLGSHPHVTPLLQVIDTHQSIMLVFGYEEGGDLYEMVVRKGRLSERRAKLMFRQIVETVAYFHDKGIVHRDLKPENMLLSADGVIKIIDYGFVNVQTSEKMLTTFCGSMAYAAPEMLSGEQYLGPGVDTWSLGVTLYWLVTGRLPFEHSNPSSLYTMIVSGSLSLPSHVSPDLEKLIRQMLAVDPQNRISLAQVLQSPWLVPAPLSTWSSSHSAVDTHVHSDTALDPAILEEMKTVGFTNTAAVADTVSRCVPSPALAAYTLLKQRYRRLQHQLQLQQRLSMDSVDSLPEDPNGAEVDPGIHDLPSGWKTGLPSGGILEEDEEGE
ncbi:MAP microtubule affinity-regulating kinase 1 [Sorochytrium milnesiophthora]